MMIILTIYQLKNLFLDKSSSGLEQRIKDKLRRSTVFNKLIKPFVNQILFRKMKKNSLNAK